MHFAGQVHLHAVMMHFLQGRKSLCDAVHAFCKGGCVCVMQCMHFAGQVHLHAVMMHFLQGRMSLRDAVHAFLQGRMSLCDAVHAFYRTGAFACCNACILQGRMSLCEAVHAFCRTGAFACYKACIFCKGGCICMMQCLLFAGQVHLYAVMMHFLQGRMHLREAVHAFCRTGAFACCDACISCKGG